MGSNILNRYPRSHRNAKIVLFLSNKLKISFRKFIILKTLSLKRFFLNFAKSKITFKILSKHLNLDSQGVFLTDLFLVTKSIMEPYLIINTVIYDMFSSNSRCVVGVLPLVSDLSSRTTITSRQLSLFLNYSLGGKALKEKDKLLTCVMINKVKGGTF